MKADVRYLHMSDSVSYLTGRGDPQLAAPGFQRSTLIISDIDHAWCP